MQISACSTILSLQPHILCFRKAIYFKVQPLEERALKCTVGTKAVASIVLAYFTKACAVFWLTISFRPFSLCFSYAPGAVPSLFKQTNKDLFWYYPYVHRCNAIYWKNRTTLSGTIFLKKLTLPLSETISFPLPNPGFIWLDPSFQSM